jgi:hypothetical protein
VSKSGTQRYVSTKRPQVDTVEWVLSHYDELDRALLKEAARVLSLANVINTQWKDFWLKRGFATEAEAYLHATRKGLPRVVLVTKGDVANALERISQS